MPAAIAVLLSTASAHCVCQRLLQGGGLAAVADLGGSILTGIDGNPLAVLARQLRIPLHHINSEGVPLYCADGREANRRLDQQARSLAAHVYDQLQPP